MKEPHLFGLKKLLCKYTCFSKLEIVYKSQYDAGTDSPTTHWLLYNHRESPVVKLLPYEGSLLLDIVPDYLTVCRVKQEVELEVEEYSKFLKDNAEELIVYRRLHSKYGNTANE